jgi:hypothetical protein
VIVAEVKIWLWHGRWHRTAIAAIVEQGQVLSYVGQGHSLTCGFTVIANIGEGTGIFKTGEAGSRLGVWALVTAPKVLLFASRPVWS